MYIEHKSQLVNRADRPDLARGKRRVHYLHVPKCGGTTLRYVLEAYAATRGLTSANEARRVDGASPDLSAADVVMGHEHPAGGISRDDTCYFTVLRDPVQRLRSLVAMLADRKGRPVDDVVSDLTWTQANWAVHLLTGATGPEGDPVAAAKRILATRVHLFGFQERFEELIALVCAMLDIDGLIYPSFQYTPSDMRLDQRFDTAFANMAATDRALFAFAHELYEKRFRLSPRPKPLERRLPNRPYLCVRVRADSTEVDVSEVRFA